MATVKLDGAGTQKLKALDDAQHMLQSVHAVVERMAIEIKNQKPIALHAMQLKRVAVPLQGLLKGQFSSIADLVASMILISGRGGSDAVRLRAFREHVGQLRTAIDVAMSKVKEQHAEVGESLTAD